MLLNQPLIDIATDILWWIQPYKTLELILVIIIVPLIMNGFAFWFQDNFLMKKSTPPPPEQQPAAEASPQKEEEERTTGVEGVKV